MFEEFSCIVITEYAMSNADYYKIWKEQLNTREYNFRIVLQCSYSSNCNRVLVVYNCYISKNVFWGKIL